MYSVPGLSITKKLADSSQWLLHSLIFICPSAHFSARPSAVCLSSACLLSVRLSVHPPAHRCLSVCPSDRPSVSVCWIPPRHSRVSQMCRLEYGLYAPLSVCLSVLSALSVCPHPGEGDTNLSTKILPPVCFSPVPVWNPKYIAHKQEGNVRNLSEPDLYYIC